MYNGSDFYEKIKTCLAVGAARRNFITTALGRTGAAGGAGAVAVAVGGGGGGRHS